MSDVKNEPRLELPLEIPKFADSVPEEVDGCWTMSIDANDDGEPVGPVMAADEVPSQPPERVRFTAPVTVRREGSDVPVDGVIYNLSIRGVAGSAPIGFRETERVWIQFQLGLADEPVKLLCEVIWCAKRDDGHTNFGVRFITLTVEEEAHIRATVNERSEGRAGDWPMPLIPEAPAMSERRGPSPVMSAAAGMAAGIGLALALSVIPSAVIGGSAPLTDVEPSNAQATEADAKPAKPDPAQATKPEAPKKVALAIPEPEPPAPAPVAPEAEPVDPAPQPMAKKARLLPRLEKSRASLDPDDDVLRPFGTEIGVELALLTDSKVVDHVSFWLENPRRLVVDVFGAKSAFARHSYGIDHPLAKRLRVGNHPGKVRFVIETDSSVSRDIAVRPSGKSLLVTLSKG